MQKALSTTFRKWLDRRIPASDQITLGQRSIFVFPTKMGFYFAVLLMIMLLTAINYQNSMIYLLVFLLSTLFVMTILLSFQNLKALTITKVSSDNAFLGEHIYVNVELSGSKNKDHMQILLSWPGECVTTTDVLTSSSATTSVQLTLATRRRGLFKADRLLIETVYPFGIVRAWSWVNLAVEAYVYPKPVKGMAYRQSDVASGEGEQSSRRGTDEFHSLRDYVPGDSLRHVAWKHFARQSQLLTKEFETPKVQSNVFSINDYPGVGVESALSHLCYDLLDAENKGDQYALDLGSGHSEMGQGEAHLKDCLIRLSTY